MLRNKKTLIANLFVLSGNITFFILNKNQMNDKCQGVINDYIKLVLFDKQLLEDKKKKKYREEIINFHEKVKAN